MYVRTTDNYKTRADATGSSLTLPQLLYYHIYGDYRIVLDEDKKPRFVYKTVPNVLENPQSFPEKKEGYFLNEFLQAEKEGVICGVYEKNPREVFTSKFESVAWFNEELDVEGTGSKFNLPSLGTQIVKSHAYGNNSDELKKSLGKELLNLIEYHEETSHDNLPYLFVGEDSDAVLPKIADLIQKLDDLVGPTTNTNLNNLDEELNPLPLIFLTTFLDNYEYQQLRDLGEKLPEFSRTSIDNNNNVIVNYQGGVSNLINAYRENSDADDEERVRLLMNLLFGLSVQKFFEGDRVYLKSPSDQNIQNNTQEARNFWSRVDAIIDVLGAAALGNDVDEQQQYIKESVFEIVGYNTDEDLFELEHIDSGTIIPNWGSDQDLGLGGDGKYWKPSHLVRADPDEEDTGDIFSTKKQKKKKGKKSKGGKKILLPPLLVFQRIFFDTFFAIQNLYYLTDRYHKEGIEQEGKNTPQQNEELMLRRLSNGTITSNKPIQIWSSYPNIIHFNRGGNSGIRPPKGKAKKKKKGKGGPKGLLDELVMLRSFYMISSLVGIRHKTEDKFVLDKFYSNDIIEQEIGWLSRALGDSAKAIVEKEEKKDLLHQIQYVRIPGTGTAAGVQETADAPKKTIFYEIEMPLFKDVMAAYIDVYNGTTIRAAFNVQKGQEPNIGTIAKAVWGTATGDRTSIVFDVEGLMPHKFFKELFNKVGEVISKSGIAKSPYPQTWTGANVVSKLTTDPQDTNEIIERDYYKVKFKEYVDHLSQVYMSNYRVPEAIISTVEISKIKYTKNPETLKAAFQERLKKDSGKQFKKTRDYVFSPYGVAISIMRGQIAIPLSFREEYIADQIDSRMRDQIRAKMDNFGDDSPVLPETHPLYKERKSITKIDPDSALDEDSTKISGGPLPNYYPKEGVRLNISNGKVLTEINEINQIVVDANHVNNPSVQTFIMLLANYNDVVPLGNAKFELIAQEIDWRNNEEKYWDGRDSGTQPNDFTSVARYRRNIGIVFQLNITGGDFEYNGLRYRIPNFQMNLEFIPYATNNITNYNSDLFRKVVGNPFEGNKISKGSHIYLPGDGQAFTYENPLKSEDDVKDILKAPKPEYSALRIEGDIPEISSMDIESADILEAMQTIGEDALERREAREEVRRLAAEEAATEAEAAALRIQLEAEEAARVVEEAARVAREAELEQREIDTLQARQRLAAATEVGAEATERSAEAQGRLADVWEDYPP